VTIEIRIERLVLDGLPVTRDQGALVRVAVREELARLVAAQGFRPGARADGAVARVDAGGFTLEPAADPGALGRQIAGSVHRGLGERR